MLAEFESDVKIEGASCLEALNPIFAQNLVAASKW